MQIILFHLSSDRHSLPTETLIQRVMYVFKGTEAVLALLQQVSCSCYFSSSTHESWQWRDGLAGVSTVDYLKRPVDPHLSFDILAVFYHMPLLLTPTLSIDLGFLGNQECSKLGSLLKDALHDVEVGDQTINLWFSGQLSVYIFIKYFICCSKVQLSFSLTWAPPSPDLNEVFLCFLMLMLLASRYISFLQPFSAVKLSFQESVFT